MPADLATISSAEYLSTLSLEDRRRSGTTYTPVPLARFVLDQAGLVPGAFVEDAPILDPACGAGVFLCEVLERAAAQIGAGTMPLTASRRRALLRFANRNLFAFDIDPEARALAIEALRVRFRELAPGPLEPGFLHENIIHDDFLLGNAPGRVASALGGGFAYIVGNPPYVATTRLDPTRKPLLRAMFATAVGRVDLYTLFFERGLQLLRPDGVLAYITPDKFLASETSRRLRAYLVKHGNVRQVARFRSHKVFPDVAVVPCVTVIDRRETRDDVRVLSCSSHRGSEVQVTGESRTPRAELSDAPWQFRRPELMALVDKMRTGRPTLAALARRISAGPATGRDDVYVQPADEFDVEPELVRPALRGRDVAAYSIADPGLRVLLPFKFENGSPSLVSLAHYPRARRYLERHRKILEQRHCVRVWDKAWFDLHDLPATDITSVPKIVVPDIAEGCRFAVDRGRFFPLHSAYYIVLEHETHADYVTAILNSTVVEFAIRLLAPVAKDGFSRFRRQFLATIPIPSAIARERARFVDVAGQRDFDELDARVARAYDLGPGDLHMMKEHLRSIGRRGDA